MAFRAWRGHCFFARIYDALTLCVTSRLATGPTEVFIPHLLRRGVTAILVVQSSSVILLLASTCLADVIHFKHGGSQEGIIIEETKETIRFRTNLGTMALSRDRVETVEKHSEERNRALENKWREEKEKGKKIEIAPAPEAKEDKEPRSGEDKEPKTVEVTAGPETAGPGEPQTGETEADRGESAAPRVLTPSARKELTFIRDKIRHLRARSLDNTRRIASIRQEMAQFSSMDRMEQMSAEIDRIEKQDEKIWQEINDLRKRKKELLTSEQVFQPTPK